jgi:CRP/FNR family transcriptional regulator, cyclic AMP receptor protein
MDRDTAERVLLTHGWLANLSRDLASTLLRRSRLAAYAPRAAVYHADDPPGGIYGIAAGAFGILAAAEGREPRLAHLLRRGAWFGHGPLLGGGRRVLAVRAMEPSVVLHLPLAALEEVARGSIAGARSMALLANANSAIAAATIADLLIPRAVPRIAATLLRVTGAAPADPGGYCLTQSELGEMANASRQIVNRALSRFAGSGWIALGYQRIAVLDPAALAAFANAAEDG